MSRFSLLIAFALALTGCADGQDTAADTGLDGFSLRCPEGTYEVVNLEDSSDHICSTDVPEGYDVVEVSDSDLQAMQSDLRSQARANNACPPDTDKFYFDKDGDEHGRQANWLCADNAPNRYVKKPADQKLDDWKDCKDNDDSVFPGQTEICFDGKNNNCQSGIDEGCGGASDADLDGYSVANGDCDDSAPDVNPGRPEVCDASNRDENCAGGVDENCPVQYVWYRDMDGDGFGQGSLQVWSYVQPAGYAEDPGDCDDNAATRFPGASEYCDGLDNDCDGVTDESCSGSGGGGSTSTWYYDGDNDGYGKTSQSVNAVSKPNGYVALSGDCNDGNAAISPGDTEVTNGIDDDCDGSVDESGGSGGSNSVEICARGTSSNVTGELYLKMESGGFNEDFWPTVSPWGDPAYSSSHPQLIEFITLNGTNWVCRVFSDSELSSGDTLRANGYSWTLSRYLSQSTASPNQIAEIKIGGNTSTAQSGNDWILTVP